MGNILHCITLVFLLSLWGSANAWVGSAALKENKDYPGKCYYEGGPVKPIILDDGEVLTAPPGYCYQMRCNVLGRKLYELDFTGCGTVSGPPPCQVVSDNTKVFPYCCPKLLCEPQLLNQSNDIQ